MLKTTLVMSALAAFAFITPAFAQDKMECSEANMMKMKSDTEMMTDAAKKEMAMKEMAMAEDMMKQNKMDDCAMHMEKAMEEMKK